MSLPRSSIVFAKPSLALLWLQSSCALEGREALLGETLSPAQSRGCGQAQCLSALQKSLVVRIGLRTGVYLLSVKFLPAWYLNPWAMLFELLHIASQRTSPLYRAQ